MSIIKSLFGSMNTRKKSNREDPEEAKKHWDYIRSRTLIRDRLSCLDKHIGTLVELAEDCSCWLPVKESGICSARLEISDAGLPDLAIGRPFLRLYTLHFTTSDSDLQKALEDWFHGIASLSVGNLQETKFDTHTMKGVLFKQLDQDPVPFHTGSGDVQFYPSRHVRCQVTIDQIQK